MTMAKSSNGNLPKKDNKPDKNKRLPNHVFACVESEDHQKTHECLMSCTRQNHDDGHDAASATGHSVAFDFTEGWPDKWFVEDEEWRNNPGLGQLLR